MAAKKKRKLKQAPREGAGRPKELPEGARSRSIRLTDAEYARVVDFVGNIRANGGIQENISSEKTAQNIGEKTPLLEIA